MVTTDGGASCAEMLASSAQETTGFHMGDSRRQGPVPVGNQYKQTVSQDILSTGPYQTRLKTRTQLFLRFLGLRYSENPKQRFKGDSVKLQGEMREVQASRSVVLPVSVSKGTANSSAGAT